MGGSGGGIRVAVLVSEDRSDLFFANRLAKSLNVVGIIVERQYGAPSGLGRLGKALKHSLRPGLLLGKLKETVIGGYYGRRAERIAVEGFGPEGTGIDPALGCGVAYTDGPNDINDPRYVEQVKRLAPDVIAVCGTSILKGPMLSAAPGRVLNLHGGLSQRYRGVWTTLWAIYNEEPEWVGATVHYVSEGIDDGRIIYQGSPEIEAHDNHETLYVKVVKLGIELMVRAIEDIREGRVQSYPLESKGKLYLRSMVTAGVVREAWKKVEKGVIRDYVRRKNGAGCAEGPRKARAWE